MELVEYNKYVCVCQWHVHVHVFTMYVRICEYIHNLYVLRTACFHDIVLRTNHVYCNCYHSNTYSSHLTLPVTLPLSY